MASDLEWVVVNSFGLVEPSEYVHHPEFENWTMMELYGACHDTDCVDYTRKLFFDNEETSRKLKMYISSFDGACSVLSENRRAIQEPFRLHGLRETVEEWSNGVDPIVYVVMLKRRTDKMARKITIMKNTIDVWKNEAAVMNKKCAELEKKVRFLKKR